MLNRPQLTLLALALAAAVFVYLRRRSSGAAGGNAGLPSAFNPTFEGTRV